MASTVVACFSSWKNSTAPIGTRCPVPSTEMTWINRSGAVYGSGRSSAAWTTLNIAVLLPTPTASARTASAVNPGSRANPRMLCRRSKTKPCMGRPSRSPLLVLLALLPIRSLADFLQLLLALRQLVHLHPVRLQERDIGRIQRLAQIGGVDLDAARLDGDHQRRLGGGHLDHDVLAGADPLRAQGGGDAGIAVQRLRFLVESLRAPRVLLNGFRQARVPGDRRGEALHHGG